MPGVFKAITSVFSAPKVPAPQIISSPAIDTSLSDKESQDALTEESKRRAAATGSSGNIVSSLTKAVDDLSSTSKKSTLLGG